MSASVLGIVFLCVFLLLMLIGVPIAVSFAVTGFIGFALLRGFEVALSQLGTIPYGSASTYAFIVLPLFVLMGNLTQQAGIATDLFAAAHKWIGDRAGGLALATQITCTGFAACTGSSLASAATMSTICLPEMKRFRYDPRLATGTVAAGGTLGILIPPSTIFIIYGFMTETSIGKLFIAGILPGLLLSLMFLMLIYFMCRRNPVLGPRGPHFSWRERFFALRGIWGVLALFLLVVGGIYTGIITPTEAGAIGAFGAFVLTLIRRRLTLGVLIATLKATVRTTAMIFLIFIGTQLFNSFLAMSGIPAMITEGISAFSSSPYVVLALILIVYIPLGMLLDSVPMILITLSLFFPLVVRVGFDPVWFGVLVVVMCELANITPPVGLNLFIVQGAARDVPLKQVVLGATPFMFVMLACVAILVAFPQISLFLPNTMR